MSQDFVIEIAGGKKEIKEGEDFYITFRVPESYWENRKNPGRYDHFKWKSTGASKAGHVNINNDIENFYSSGGYASFVWTDVHNSLGLYGSSTDFSFKTYDSYEAEEIFEVELYLYQPYGGGFSDVLASDSIIVKDFHDEPRPFFGTRKLKDDISPYSSIYRITPRAGQIWVDSNVNTNRFQFSGKLSSVRYDGKSWQLPAVGVGGKGDDTYEVYSKRFVIVADGGSSSGDKLYIHDYANDILDFHSIDNQHIYLRTKSGTAVVIIDALKEIGHIEEIRFKDLIVRSDGVVGYRSLLSEFATSDNRSMQSLIDDGLLSLASVGIQNPAKLRDSIDDIYGFYNLQENDQVAPEPTEGRNRIKSSINTALSGREKKLKLTGNKNINGIGNQLNNQIAGNQANNMITGKDGDDILQGLGGKDVLRGGRGNDILIGGTGKNILYGGDGADEFLFDDPNGFENNNRDIIQDFNHSEGDSLAFDKDVFGVNKLKNVDFAGNYKKIWMAAKSNYDFVYDEKNGLLYFNENGREKGWGRGGLFVKFQGSPELGVKNTAGSNSGDNLNGNNGNDGNNTIVGTNRNETIVGTDEDDVITGKKGNDILKGKKGNDVISGGMGRDDLYGGK